MYSSVIKYYTNEIHKTSLHNNDFYNNRINFAKCGLYHRQQTRYIDNWQTTLQGAIPDSELRITGNATLMRAISIPIEWVWAIEYVYGPLRVKIRWWRTNGIRIGVNRNRDLEDHDSSLIFYSYRQTFS